ncbi:MAG: hypothetical protein RSE14_01305 [Erythrobacter sp.]|uniref:hypothetical protein n=1 Tax=Erythrobacter sp. TaxID=1042 RepID=UPI002B49F625|nr:hypothetical protein [Erythrobacter sp.]WRH70758.1 MAG: hypothetical protein RSE14_01305 [Erythrobacter sp.]
MSTSLIEAEIKRFLRDDRAEVLCIKGKWGVGKTFAWRKWLADIEADGSLKSKSYAYVSLFGLNSLDILKYSIFEATVTPEHLLTGPDVSTVNALVRKGFDLGRKSKGLLEPILALAGSKDGGEALFRSAYMLVKNQLVCLDDLERAGEGLAQRDVLGLASALKEQRNCKVVLLLNVEEMAPEQKQEFERQLEKVVDVSLVFDPNPQEAAAIALSGNTELDDMLRKRTISLGIVNIRVIKKIERLAARICAILAGTNKQVMEQAVSSVVLGGWAELQPSEAPAFETLKSYNRLVMSLKAGKSDREEERPKWADRLENYDFTHTDDLDLVIFEGVQSGFFDEQKLKCAAKSLEDSIIQNSRDNSYAKAWDQYWHDLSVPDEKLLKDIHTGALENLGIINPVNLSGTAGLLRESGMNAEADDLIDRYMEARKDEGKAFFDLYEHHFMSGDAPDPRLIAAFEAKRATFVDVRDPGQVLIQMSAQQGWEEEDVELLASLTAKQLMAVFDAMKGPELRRSIQFAHTLAKSGSEHADTLNGRLAEAMKTMAARSYHTKRRLKSWRVPL